MASNRLLDTRTRRFGELIGNGESYKIPPFQRSYAWHVENWEDLWQDVVASHETNDIHYMGTIVLQSAAGNDRTKVIDGQQRLATLSILIVAVIQRIKNLAENGIDSEANLARAEILRRSYLGDRDPTSLTYSSKLLLNNDDNSFYQDNLINFSPPWNPRALTSPEQLLWGAFTYFSQQIGSSDLSQEGELLSDLLTQTVVRRLWFIVVYIEDEINAYTLFETLNSRGVALGATDLLKNYLFSALKSTNDLNAAQRQWQSITRVVGMERFPQFLRCFLSMTYKRVRRNRLFKLVRSNISTPDAVFDLLKQLRNYSELYVALGNPNDEFWNVFNNSIAIRDYIRQLDLFEVEQVHPVLLAAYQKVSDQNFGKLLKLLIILSFRYAVISGLNPNELEDKCGKLALEISSGKVKTAREAFGVVSSLYVSDEKFQQDFSLLSIKRKKNVVKYILSQLEKDMGSGASEDSFSIEHILPQEPTEEWQKSFREHEIDSMVYRLGNVTPLEPTLNRKIGNLPYDDKQKAYAQSNYRLTQQIQAEDWTADSIAMRQARLAKRAVHIWRIDLQTYPNTVFVDRT